MLPYLLAALLLVSAQAQGDPNDVAALKALKDSITNWGDVSNGIAFYGWQDGTDPCGGDGGMPWLGVMCMDVFNAPGRVTDLVLAFMGPGSVQGTLPAELDKLTALRNLDFTGQHFTGSLPPSWGANGGFASLEMMNLGQNQLQSSLPSEWGAPDRFQKLQALELFSNELSGNLPESWGSEGAFPSLRIMVLSNNKLSGSLPGQWKEQLPKLESVDVAANTAFDSVPAVWDKLKSFWRVVCGDPAAARPAELEPVVDGPPHTRSLLQWSRCSGNQDDPHCRISKDSSTSSLLSTSSFGGGNKEDWDCQTSADGKSQSCTYSSSSSSPSATGKSQGFWGSVGTAATTWWVWVLAILLAIGAALALARRRNVYVMLRGGSEGMGLPRFQKGKDNREAELF